MKCKNIEILMSDMLEDRLDESTLKRLKNHLDSCPSCREKQENLQNYKLIVSILEDQKVPADLKNNIWESIENDREESEIDKIRKLKPKAGLVVATLAASILLLISIKPFSPPVLKLESSFSFTVEKRGKGPAAEKVYKKGSDPRIDKIMAIADSSGISYTRTGINSDNGEIDFLSLKIPSGKYNTFRELYNVIGEVDTLPSLPVNYRRKYIELQVYIPGRNFFIGDFNGDSLDDFGLYFNRGKNTGQIFISINREGKFGKAVEARTDNHKLVLKAGDKIMAGDFNGDSLDDLMIYYSDSSATDKIRFFLNTGDNNFISDNSFIFDKIHFDNNIWKKFLAGDFNGDGFDDIAVINFRGEHKGLFNIYLNKHNKSFEKPYFFDADFDGMEEDEWFTPLLMDLNGDSLADPGIYWQSGERDAYWYFSINDGNGRGSKTFYAGFGKGYMAFMGTYLPLWGDTDGDGFDDLIVKLGVEDEISEWYLMQNRQDSTFALGKMLLFKDENDLIIR